MTGTTTLITTTSARSATRPALTVVPMVMCALSATRPAEPVLVHPLMSVSPASVEPRLTTLDAAPATRTVPLHMQPKTNTVLVSARLRAVFHSHVWVTPASTATMVMTMMPGSATNVVSKTVRTATPVYDFVVRRPSFAETTESAHVTPIAMMPDLSADIAELAALTVPSIAMETSTVTPAVMATTATQLSQSACSCQIPASYL